MKWLILFDENYLLGGLQSCSREIASLIIDDGGSVDFVCTREDPFVDIAAANPHVVRVYKPGPLPTRSLRLAALRHAWRILRTSNPDVLFFCTTGAPNFLPFLFLAPWFGVKHRIVQFGTEVANPDGRFGATTWGREFVNSARVAYRSMTLGLFNNDQQRDQWITAFGFCDKCCSVWNYPVNLERFRPLPSIRKEVRRRLGLQESQFVVGGVGALNAQKSFHIAIRALAEVRNRIPHAHLVIAGNGDRDTLTSLAGELGVADRLHLLGERDDVPQLMNAFDVFCIPSTHPNETLGIAFVEAQACGVPIVVPDLPGPRRVAADGACGIIVEPGNSAALAAAWESVYGDPALRQRLVTNGIENAKAFERDSVFRRLKEEAGMIGWPSGRPKQCASPSTLSAAMEASDAGRTPIGAGTPCDQ